MTTPEDQEVSTSMSSDDAAAELLKRWTGNESTEAEEPQEEPTEQADDADAQDADSEDVEAEESGEVEIDVAGEKFKLPTVLAEQAKKIEAKVKEIEAGTTRKFQEAAEIRKAAEAQIQSARQMQEIALQQSELIADHRTVMRRLEQLERTDFDALAQQDPVALARATAEYQQLNSAKQRIEQAYAAKVNDTKQAQEKLTTERMQRLASFAEKNIGGWSEAYSQTLLTFATETLGFDAEQLRGNLNEAAIKGLDLAYRGWKVQTSSPKDKQVQATKTLKPGAATQAKTNNAVNADKAMQKVRKTGNVSDAAMALLARSNTKRR